MKGWMLALIWLGIPPLASRIDVGPFTAERLEALDRDGYLTPAFKAAAEDLIDARRTQRAAQAEKARLEGSLSGLKKDAAEEEGKVAALRRELALYVHLDETDFTALQAKMKDPHAQPEEQRALAQAYVWTYPTSPRQTEAEQYLAQIQKKLADQVQAANNDEAARTAAAARLLQRVQARSLSLEEWRVFLQDKTQTEVTQYLGHPSDVTEDNWTYAGTWTTDPVTGQKAGLHLIFNGGRVLTVSPIPVP